MNNQDGNLFLFISPSIKGHRKESKDSKENKRQKNEEYWKIYVLFENYYIKALL